MRSPKMFLVACVAQLNIYFWAPLGLKIVKRNVAGPALPCLSPLRRERLPDWL